MYIMRNLPVLLALSASIVLCLSGIFYEADLNEILGKLVIGVIVFYLFGIFVRKIFFTFLINMLAENERKAKLIREMQLYEKEKEKNKLRNKQSNISYDDMEPFTPPKIDTNSYD